MDVLSFYSGLLSAAGMGVNDKGEIFIEMADTKNNLTISGQTVVMPTKEVLAAGIKEDQIAFHPACEGIARKESTILKRYRKVISYRLNWVLAELLSQLMTIAVDTGQHAKLSPTQGEYLSVMANADKKTLDALEKVLSKLNNEKVDRRLISIFIKRPGLLKGKEYPRVAVVNFPILDAIKDADPSIFGVKMRQKDKDSIVKLFLTILPNAEILNEYSFGTNDMVAPNLYSLMMASVGLFEKINDKVLLFSDLLDVSDELTTDLSFVNGLESLAKYRALIPEQRGNAGEKLDGSNDDDDEVTTSAPAPVEKKRIQIGYPAPDKDRPVGAPVVQQQYHAPQPTAHQQYQERSYPQPVETKSVEKRDWRDVAREAQPAPQQQYYPDPRYTPQQPPAHYPPPNYVDPRVDPRMDPRYAPQQPPQPYYQPAPQPQYYPDPRYAPPQPAGVSPGRAEYMRQQQYQNQVDPRYADPRYSDPRYTPTHYREPIYSQPAHGSKFYR